MRATEPAAAYPVEALGEVLAGAARAIHEKVQAPLPVCASSVLAAAALAAQAHANVVLPTGQRRPLSLYFLTIAASGERKSSCDIEALAPVNARERELRAEHERGSAEFATAEAAYGAQRAKVLNDKRIGDRAQREDALRRVGTPPVKPLDPMLTAPEPTFEGVCRLLAEGQPSIGVFSAEGGQFIGGHAMNAENRLKTAAGFSLLWDDGTVKRLRSADGAQILASRRMSFHLMVQPAAAGLFLSDPVLRDQGCCRGCSSPRRPRRRAHAYGANRRRNAPLRWTATAAC
jgi:hypothetical protein